jgi:hypothetical protein
MSGLKVTVPYPLTPSAGRPRSLEPGSADADTNDSVDMKRRVLWYVNV